jgi:hypothetical protein
MAVNVFIEKRGQLSELHSSVTSVFLLKDFLEVSSASEVLAGLISLTNLEQIEIDHFSSTESDKIKIGQIAEGLTRFKNLKSIAIQEPLPPDVALSFSHSNFESLGLSLSGCKQDMIDAVAGIEKLKFLNLRIYDYTARDLSPLLRLKDLEVLSLQGGTYDADLEIRKQMKECGLVQRKRFTGIIGDFYETGKEFATREFLADTEPSLRDYALRAGDRLEVFNVQGDCIFDGVLEPTDHREGLWSQTGVDKKTWHDWFIKGHRAAVSTDVICLPKGFRVFT